jgi:BirA family transcriptional regulator, biotin operon repressor / biotin---[acetyl-CoA-carboxylase] ligase
MIRAVAQTGSTNADMLVAAGAGAAEGAWLRADRQTGGRGREGRVWQSPPGNLYATTLVRLRPGDPDAATLALVAGVALEEVGSAYVRADLRLKWPNDLLAGPAKLAGILLERADDAVVIGFGANLAHVPVGLGRPATSLVALGAGVEPAAFLAELAPAFARWLGRWRSEGLAPVRARWLERAHPLGTALRTSDEEGLFDGLDPDGALRLRRADGTVARIRSGDVFLL